MFQVQSMDFVQLFLAVGAVGTSAMGLVEALRFSKLGLAGLEAVKAKLSVPSPTADTLC